MGLPASATQGLVSSLRNIAGRLGKTGMLSAAEQVEKQTINKALLGSSVPGAIMVAGFNMLGGVDPMTSLAAGALDLGINYGGMKLAGRLSPGRMGTLTHQQDGKTVTRPEFIPSRAQGLVQGLSPIVSSIAAMPLIQNSLIQQQQQQQEDMDQTVSMQQQAMQRELINGLQAQALSPGTQFQMQGLEQTIDPSTLMANMADPYGYGRGII
jgi:hypothetical protein